MEEFSPFRWLDKLGIRARISPTRRWSSFTSWYKHAAFWMVIVGIGGEGIFEYFANHADGEVRSFDESVTSQLRDRADRAEHETEELKRQNLELERELSPKRLSGKDQLDLIALLKPSSPITASLQYLQDDSEARRLAAELVVPLNQAWGTKLPVPTLSALDDDAMFGIVIGFNTFRLSQTDADRLRGAAQTLARWLNDHGIRAIINQMNADLPENPPGLLVVWVGLKPNPTEDKSFLEILAREPEPFRSQQIRKWFPEKKR